jgi:hypothetical protein
MKGKFLITTEGWFYAPDGKKYRAAWGEVEILEDNILGIKTNRQSTNWYARIGNNDRHILIAGCQINYALKCEKKPHANSVEEIGYTHESCSKITRDSEIYLFD